MSQHAAIVAFFLQAPKERAIGPGVLSYSTRVYSVRHYRYVMLFYVASAILTGLVVQSACASLFAQFAIPDTRLLGLLDTSSVLSVLSAAGTFFGLLRHRRATKFVDDVVSELLRVVWPTRDETVRASTTVAITTIFTAALLAVYDLIWKNLADLVLFTNG